MTEVARLDGPPPRVWGSIVQSWRERTGTEQMAYGLSVLLVLGWSTREQLAQVIALAAVLFLGVLWVRGKFVKPAGVQRMLHGLVLAQVAYGLLHVVRLHRAEDLHALDGPLRFILLAPLAYLPMQARLRWAELWPWMCAGGALLGLAALLGWGQALPDRSFGWFTYYNLFGFASTATLSLLLLRLPPAGEPLAWWSAGVVGSLLASLASGTRGAWLAAIPVALALAWSRGRAVWRHGGRARLGLAVLGIALVTVLATASPVHHRMHLVMTDLQKSWHAGDYNSSTGQRLAMWKVSIAMIEDRPLTGQGLSAFPGQMQSWADRLGLNVRFEYGGFRNPHNQYLGWAAVHGLPIAVLLFALTLVAPLVVTIRLKADPEAARSLILFVTMAMLFCLTESVLERQRGSAWFVCWIALLVGCAAHATADRRQAPATPEA